MVVESRKSEVVGYVPALLIPSLTGEDLTMRTVCAIPCSPRKPTGPEVLVDAYLKTRIYKPTKGKTILLTEDPLEFTEGKTHIGELKHWVTSPSVLRDFFHVKPNLVLLTAEGKEPIPMEGRLCSYPSLKLKEVLWEPEVRCHACGKVREGPSISYHPIMRVFICNRCAKYPLSPEKDMYMFWSKDYSSWEETVKTAGRKLKLPTRKVGLTKLIYPEGYASYELSNLKKERYI